MHNLTLVGRLFSLLFFVGAAFPAHAQQSPGNTGGGFCALAGTDLLAALNGAWTIQQGAGLAAGQHNGRAISIPLPPAPAASVKFNYDAQRRVIDVQSADLAEGMVMFPTAPPQQSQASQMLGAQPVGNAAASGSGCDWSSLPIVIGTNYYAGVGGKFVAQAKHLQSCKQIFEYMSKPSAHPAWQDYYDKSCTGKVMPPALFEMEMTIVLRFSNSQSGSGSVHFTGKQDDATFAASAPVQVSR